MIAKAIITNLLYLGGFIFINDSRLSNSNIPENGTVYIYKGPNQLFKVSTYELEETSDWVFYEETTIDDGRLVLSLKLAVDFGVTSDASNIVIAEYGNNYFIIDAKLSRMR